MAFAITEYEKDGRRRKLIAGFVDDHEWGDAARALAEIADGERVVVDLYAHENGYAETLISRLKQALEEVDLPPSVERVVLDVPAPERGVSAADAITLRRTPDGRFTVDHDLQGVHPEMGERLGLWRMSEFALERIPSAPDVYLFRGTGRSTPTTSGCSRWPRCAP